MWPLRDDTFFQATRIVPVCLFQSYSSLWRMWVDSERYAAYHQQQYGQLRWPHDNQLHQSRIWLSSVQVRDRPHEVWHQENILRERRLATILLAGQSLSPNQADSWEPVQQFWIQLCVGGSSFHVASYGSIRLRQHHIGAFWKRKLS